MTNDLIVKTLQRAYENELPQEGCIFQSDQGSQYYSHEFQDLLQEYGLRSSMSRRVRNTGTMLLLNLFGQP